MATNYLGPLYGGTAVDDSSIGTAVWATPSNGLVYDNTGTQASPSIGTPTHYLKVTGYSFAVPTNATIRGIIVNARVWRLGGPATTCADNAVRIVKGDSIGATDKSSASNWPRLGTGSANFISHGSASDLWGETWTATDINGSTFGAAISAKRTGAKGGAIGCNIDTIRITVYYDVMTLTGVLSMTGVASITG